MRHRSSNDIVAERNPYHSLSSRNSGQGSLATIQNGREVFRVGATGHLTSSVEQHLEHKSFRQPRMQRLSSPIREVVIIIGSLTMPLGLDGYRRYKLGTPLAGSCCVVSLAWRRTEIRHCTLTSLKAEVPFECRSYAGLCRASAVANERRV